MLMDAYLHLFMDTYLWKRKGGYPYDLGNLYIGYIYMGLIKSRQNKHQCTTARPLPLKIAVVALTV